MDNLPDLITCPGCGILLRDGINGLECPSCGHTEPYDDVKRPGDADGLAGINGG